MTNTTSICDKCQNTCKAPHPMNQCAIFKIKSMFNSTTRKRTAEEIAENIINNESWYDPAIDLTHLYLLYKNPLKKLITKSLSEYGSQCRKEGYDDGVKKSPCHMAMLNAYEQGREEALAEISYGICNLQDFNDGFYKCLISKKAIRSLKEKKE